MVIVQRGGGDPPSLKRVPHYCGRRESCSTLDGDRPKTHVQQNISTGTHDAKTLQAKARERAAKGSRKVRKSVPTTSLVAWHSWTVAHAYGFFLTILFFLSQPSFPKKTCPGTCCNVASPARHRSAPSTFAHHQYHCPSMKSLPGQMLQNGFSRKARGRRAKGT